MTASEAAQDGRTPLTTPTEPPTTPISAPDERPDSRRKMPKNPLRSSLVSERVRVVTEAVTRSRLRTLTLVVTRQGGPDGSQPFVFTSTSYKPDLQTSTVTRTITETLPLSLVGSEQARAWNLATKVMSNGVEVIVATDKSTLPGEPEVLRVLPSSPITLAPSTLTDHMMLLMPSQVELDSAQFVTRTYVTTYTLVETSTSKEHVVSNVATEQLSPAGATSTPLSSVGVTVTASPVLSTAVYHTTYTYLNTLLDGEVPLVLTSRKTVSNTVTAPGEVLASHTQAAQDAVSTNTYLSTVQLTRTLSEGDQLKVVSTQDVLTQVVITESQQQAQLLTPAPAASPAPASPPSEVDDIAPTTTEVVKTYLVTYTYYSTYLEGERTVVRSDVAVSTDITTETFLKKPKRTSALRLETTTSLVEPTPVPPLPASSVLETTSRLPPLPHIHVVATKTYLTTFTYFTTLLQGTTPTVSTVVSSRTRVVQNVVTESIATSLLNPDYFQKLRSSFRADAALDPSRIVATATLQDGQQMEITAMVDSPANLNAAHPTEESHAADATLSSTPTPALGSATTAPSSTTTKASNVNDKVITGSTIIFFDDSEQADKASTSSTSSSPAKPSAQKTPSASSDKASRTHRPPHKTHKHKVKPTTSVKDKPSASAALGNTYRTSVLSSKTVTPSGATLMPGEQVIVLSRPDGSEAVIPVGDPATNKRPSGDKVDKVGELAEQGAVAGPNLGMSDLLQLGSIGITGINALRPVFSAMAGLLSPAKEVAQASKPLVVVHKLTHGAPHGPPHGPLAPPGLQGPPSPPPFQKLPPLPVPATTPAPILEQNPLLSYAGPQPPERLVAAGSSNRNPIYIPVGGLAGHAKDSVAEESQRVEGHVKLNAVWPDAEQRLKLAQEAGLSSVPGGVGPGPGPNVVLGRPTLESPLLAGGIPIQPGQVITTNSDVIIGKPSVHGPRPPKHPDETPIGMKPPPPPPPPQAAWPEHDRLPEDTVEHEDQLGHHDQPVPAATGIDEEQDRPERPQFNEHIANLLPPPLREERPSGGPAIPHRHLHPHHTHHKHHEILDLSPPANQPAVVHAPSEEVPLSPPPPPPQHHLQLQPHPAPDVQHIVTVVGSHALAPVGDFGPTQVSVVPQGQTVFLGRPVSQKINVDQPHLTPDTITVPIILPGNPQVVERASGQPLLVNIQPSQVANVIIPHGSSTALIYSGDTLEHGKKGEYFDDPLPYPTGAGSSAVPSGPPKSSSAIRMDVPIPPEGIQVQISAGNAVQGPAVHGQGPPPTSPVPVPNDIKVAQHTKPHYPPHHEQHFIVEQPLSTPAGGPLFAPTSPQLSFVHVNEVPHRAPHQGPHNGPAVQQILHQQQQIQEQQLRDQQLYEQKVIEQQLRDQQIHEQKTHEQQLRDQQNYEQKVREQQVRDQQIHEQKIREQQLRDQQMYEQKIREQQLRDQQIYEQKVREQQIRDQQIHEQKIHEQQVRDQQIYEQKVHEQKLRDQQIHQQKLHEQKVHEQQLQQHLHQQEQLQQLHKKHHSNRPAGPVEPVDYMVPPPLTTASRPQVPLPDQDNDGEENEPIESEGGELIQESNARPLRPGQVPIEIEVANSKTTERPQPHKPRPQEPFRFERPVLKPVNFDIENPIKSTIIFEQRPDNSLEPMQHPVTSMPANPPSTAPPATESTSAKVEVTERPSPRPTPHYGDTPPPPPQRRPTGPGDRNAHDDQVLGMAPPPPTTSRPHIRRPPHRKPRPPPPYKFEMPPLPADTMQPPTEPPVLPTRPSPQPPPPPPPARPPPAPASSASLPPTSGRPFVNRPPVLEMAKPHPTITLPGTQPGSQPVESIQHEVKWSDPPKRYSTTRRPPAPFGRPVIKPFKPGKLSPTRDDALAPALAPPPPPPASISPTLPQPQPTTSTSTTTSTSSQQSSSAPSAPPTQLVIAPTTVRGRPSGSDNQWTASPSVDTIASSEPTAPASSSESSFSTPLPGFTGKSTRVYLTRHQGSSNRFTRPSTTERFTPSETATATAATSNTKYASPPYRAPPRRPQLSEVVAVLPTRFITHTQTLVLTTTETTVVRSEGQRPTTKTVVLTSTTTSTIVDTVTETQTLVQPTSVFETVTKTVSHTHTQIHTTTAEPPEPPVLPTIYPPWAVSPVPSQEDVDPNESIDVHLSSGRPASGPSATHHDGEDDDDVITHQDGGDDSIFLVMTDRKPGSVQVHKVPPPAIEDEPTNADETNEVKDNAVLLGGVLVASPPAVRPAVDEQDGQSLAVQCLPECSATRNELCQRILGVMRCVCRPGFARMFPDQPCKPTYTYSMRLALDRHGGELVRFAEWLSDPSSPRFARLAEATKEGLERVVMQSELRDVAHGVVLQGFAPASQRDDDHAVVNFYVQLSDNTDELRLKDVFRKSLRATNFSLGGTEVFAAREMLPELDAADFDECESTRFHDCSEHARCFNLRGTYTCSCKEGYADVSENPQFPGRACSAEQVGCEQCHYHGTCYSRGAGERPVCECFQWYTGQNCHINLKVLLIALGTVGGVLLLLLVLCCVMTCARRRRPGRPPPPPGFLRYRGPSHRDHDTRAMIHDTSSEGSIDNSQLPPYVTTMHQPVHTMSAKHKKSGMKKVAVPHAAHAAHAAADALGAERGSGVGSPLASPVGTMEQRDRSLTVMIPRAKYRAAPACPATTLSTFTGDQEHKLLAYLDCPSPVPQAGPQTGLQAGPAPHSRKPSAASGASAPPPPPPAHRKGPTKGPAKGVTKGPAPRRPSSTGALVSAGFEVSATVVRRPLDVDDDVSSRDDDEASSQHRHYHQHDHSHFDTQRTRPGDSFASFASRASSPAGGACCPVNQLATRLADLTVSEARSCDETTIQPPTKCIHSHVSNYASSKPSSHSNHNNNDESHTMVERDLGSTFLMPQTHLYQPDRGSDISNFDSL